MIPAGPESSAVSGSDVPNTSNCIVTPPTRSVDGASAPEELAHRAAELGYQAIALTDHDGVWGAMEFAQACTAFGVRPIVGRRADRRLPAGRLPFHRDAAGRGRRPGGGTSAGWSPRRTPARGRIPGREPSPPSLPLDRARAAGRGARLPVRLRAGGGARRAHFERCRRAAHAPPTQLRRWRSGGGWWPPSGASASGSSCSGRSGGTTGRAIAGWRGSPSGSASRAWRPATSTCTTRRGRRSRTRWSPCAWAGRWRRRSRERRGNGIGVSRLAARTMAARFGEHPARRRRERPARRATRLRPHPRPRLPLPGLGGPRRRPDAGRDLPGPARSPVRGRARAPTRRGGGWRRSSR